MISCGPRIKTKYLVPEIDIDIPVKPSVHTDIKPTYNKKTGKIEYSRTDGAKLLSNITVLIADNKALRIRLKGVKDALRIFKVKAHERQD